MFIRGFFYIFSRTASGFDKLAKRFELNFFIHIVKNFFSEWSNQAGKTFFTACLFSQGAALNEIPSSFKTVLVCGVIDSHNIHYVSWPGRGTLPFDML